MEKATNRKNPFIPYEVMTIILGHMLQYRTIMQCRLVCRTWNQIIEEESWKFVVKRKRYSTAQIEKISRMPWYLLHAMLSKDRIFGRNFVLSKHNSSPPYWKLADPDSPTWQIVPTDVHKESLTKEAELLNSDDFFSFKMQVGKLQNNTRAAQIIKLPKCGLTRLLLNTARPKVHFSLWVRLESDIIVKMDKPKYHALVTLRDDVLRNINDRKHQEKSNILLNARKGEWRKATRKLAIDVSSDADYQLDSIVIEHLLYNTDAKCTITRILLRLELPNFLNFDWSSISNDPSGMGNFFTFESALITQYPLLLSEATNSEVFCSSTNLLSTFDSYTDILAFPESGIFIPEVWYARPLADVIKVKDDDVEASVCYENANYLLLYELQYKINLKEHGLFGFLMDELQPEIKACIENGQTHRDEMKYNMKVSLLNSQGQTLHQKSGTEVLSKTNWLKKLSLRFNDYGPGVTYVVFNIQRHLSMNKCTQAVHGPTTFTFFNHVKNVVNASRVSVSHRVRDF